MRAAVRVAPRRIEVQDVAEPVRREGHSLVQMQAVSVCGGDLLYFQGPMPFRAVVPGLVDAPYVVCHEGVGVVADTGPASGWAVGDRVVIDPQQRCGSCEQCRAGLIQLCPHRRDRGYSADGVAAELVSVPDGQLYAVPSSVQGAAVAATHGLAAVLHALSRVPLDRVHRALVIGPGPAGLLFALALLARLDSRDVTVVGRRSPRLEVVARIGASAAVLGDAGLEPWEFAWGERSGFELVVDTTGSPDLAQQALSCVAPRGALLLYAPSTFPLDGSMVFRRELQVLGSSGATGQMPNALALQESGGVDLSQIITHEFGLGDMQRAIELALAPPDRRGSFLKALVTIG